MLMHLSHCIEQVIFFKQVEKQILQHLMYNVT